MTIRDEDQGELKKGESCRPGKLGTFLESIKFSHSIFALPFALATFFMAGSEGVSWSLLAKIVAACVLARTAAMSFNRLADARVDRLNPRTSSRAVPAGELSRTFMAGATITACCLFALCCWWINSLALYLCPLALLVLLGYSYTKRFTSLCHLFLGLALGLSPVGVWVAVHEKIELLPVLLGLAVAFWTAGFDVIYACQDYDFDRREGLHSIPAKLGLPAALFISRLFHLLTVGLLLSLGLQAEFGTFYWLGTGIVAVLLAYEQSLVKAGDLSRVNLAFFTLNGIVSLVFMTSVILEKVVS
jgi:4-hydroxybenzoate polyprenyltransferase